MDNVVEIIIRARDEFTSSIDQVKGSLKGIGVVAGVAFAGLSLFMKSAIDEATEYDAAVNRLTRILTTSRHATEEQIRVLLDQAKALDKVGVASEKNILITQSQLSTFDLSTEAIERMTPAILDYIVAEKGAAATTEDYKQLTNGLALALNGQFSSLTRTGFVLDDATKEMIKNGTETERTTAIVKVLNSTYKGFNETATSTAEGSLVQLNKEFNNMKQSIGEALLPILADLVAAITPIVLAITGWIEKHPQLTAAILIMITATAGMTAGIIALTLAWLALDMAAFPLIGTIVAISAVLAALGIAVFYVWKNFDEFKIGLAMIWNDIVGFFEFGVNKAVSALNVLVKAYNKIRSKLGLRTIDLIQDVSLGRIDVEAMASAVNAQKAVTTEITKQNDALTDQQKLINAGYRMVVRTGDIYNPKGFQSSDFTDTLAYNAAKEGGGTTTVNINNVYGIDPTQISKALSKELGTKLTL